MAATRAAEATWEHDLLHGRGSVRGESGALPELSLSWSARTELPGGKTSPEELLAAALASCYAMQFSAILARQQHPADRLKVRAACTFAKVGDGWKVTTAELTVRGTVPGLDAAAFGELAVTAEKLCPIANVVRGNVVLSLDARLEAP